MRLSQFFSTRRPAQHARTTTSPAARRCRPRLEALEDRLVPALLSDPFAFNSATTDSQTESASASSHHGDTAVVWNANGAVKAQVFDETGLRKTGEIDVAVSSATNPAPAVAMDYQGDFVVTWTGLDAQGRPEVLARRFDPSGQSLGSPTYVAPGWGARVGMDWQGDFAVSYVFGRDVRVSMRAWDGSLVRDFNVSNNPTSLESTRSSIACASDGGFALAYQTEDPSDPKNGSVFLQQFDAAGTLRHTEAFGHASDPTLEAWQPSLAVDDQGNFVLAGLFLNRWSTTWNLATFSGLRFADHDSTDLVDAGTDQVPAVAADPYNHAHYVVAYRAGGGGAVAVYESGTGAETSDLGPSEDWGNVTATVNSDHRYLVTYTDTDRTLIGQFGQLDGLPAFPVSYDPAAQSLTVNASGPSTTVTVSNPPNDPSDTPGGLAVTVNGREFDLHWADVRGGVFLNGLGGQNTFNIENVEGGHVRVTATGGSTAVNVSPVAHNLDNIRDGLTVDGGGTATLTVNDQNSGSFNTYWLSAGSVWRDGPHGPGISYSGLRALTLNGSDHATQPYFGDTYNVTGTPGGTAVTINAGAGDDYVGVGVAESWRSAAATTLDPIQGPLTVNGQGGSLDSVYFYDQATAAGQTYTLTSTGLTRSGAAAMTFGGFEIVNLLGTGRTDSLVVRGLPAGVATVNADMGAGSNVVTGPNTANTWLIDGYGNGEGHVTLNWLYKIGGVGSLVGGTAADRFVFRPAGRVPGTINGGGGGDALDYSQYNAAVTVNLAAFSVGVSGPPTYGTATAAGSVANVQTVIGSAYNDVLSGGYYGSVLVGGAGNDTLTAYRGTHRNVLVGGLGADQLTGGLGDDILIGGYTAYDANVAALTAVFREWSRTDAAATYQHRVDDLRGVKTADPLRQNGVYFLNGGTVHDDGVTDKFPGAGATDWAWA